MSISSASRHAIFVKPHAHFYHYLRARPLQRDTIKTIATTRRQSPRPASDFTPPFSLQQYWRGASFIGTITGYLLASIISTPIMSMACSTRTSFHQRAACYWQLQPSPSASLRRRCSNIFICNSFTRATACFRAHTALCVRCRCADSFAHNIMRAKFSVEAFTTPRITPPQSHSKFLIREHIRCHAASLRHFRAMVPRHWLYKSSLLQRSNVAAADEVKSRMREIPRWAQRPPHAQENRRTGTIAPVDRRRMTPSYSFTLPRSFGVSYRVAPRASREAYF